MEANTKRYKCKDCGNYITALGDIDACPQCDGELEAVTPFCKVQYLTFEDGSEELIISGHERSYAFVYDPVVERGWQPMGLVDVFKPLSKFKDCSGRIF